MGAQQQSWAIVRSDGTVETFVRLDAPEGWSPPDGCKAVPDDELPDGWLYATKSPPDRVSARQIRMWLIRNGISMGDVDAAISSIYDDVARESVRVEWEYAPYVERSHPMLIPLAAALGLTEEQVDAAFAEAAAI